jgi:hypothetical protein
MCRAMLETGIFDPTLCPLLVGLEPDEVARRMREDPDIVACRAALEGGKPAGRIGDYRCPAALEGGAGERQRPRPANR